jgi:hypothetical protein
MTTQEKGPFVRDALRDTLIDIARAGIPKPKIVTDFWMKPIPLRQFDWTATEDGWEPGMPYGHGATEAEAIADLEREIEEAKP